MVLSKAVAAIAAKPDEYAQQLASVQLFLYLKSCGRDELGTMNLWAGMDAPAPPAS